MGKAKKPPQLAGITPDQLGALPGSRVIRIEYIDLDDLDKSRAERNAKKHRLDEIDASMRRHGYASPIMVDEGTQRIVAGHGRLDTLLQRRLAGREAPDGVHVREGKWLVPVVRGIAFKDPVEAMSYLLADNQIQMLAGYDWHEAHEIAKVVAESSEGLLGTGFAGLAEIEAQMEREVKDLLGGAGDGGDGLPDFGDGEGILDASNGNNAASLKSLRYGNIVLAMGPDEAKLLEEKLEEHLTENGSYHGFAQRLIGGL